jgi:hypothetical protein
MNDNLISDILLALFLFIGSAFLIFMPPIKLVYTIIGFLGMFVAILIITVDIALEILK